MFPSIFWSTANNNYSIAGSIPSPLLLGSCKEDEFSNIQLTFVQDSQMILLPQVQTIVTLFLDKTWCVQFLLIITICSDTGKGWLHKTLQPVVCIYAASMIQIFFIILIAAIWLNIYAHLKSILNGVYLSHLLVTWENNWYKTNSWMARWWKIENYFFQLGYILFFSEARKKKIFTSIWFGKKPVLFLFII